MAKKAGNASRVVSIDELLARCSVAKEQQLSQTGVETELVVLNLGLSLPQDCTNTELNSLIPLYTKILKDVSEYPDSSPFVDILNCSSRESPDASIMLLYLLEYPYMVRNTRANISDLSECNVNEKFMASDLVDEISMNTVIVHWCRSALSSSEAYHAVVLASCINILNSINLMKNKQTAKKFIKKHILLVGKKASRDEVMDAFKVLRSDLADVVTRDDATRDSVANVVLLQMHTMTTLVGEDNAVDVLKGLPGKEAFENALSRHRDQFTPEGYHCFLAIICSDTQTLAESLSGCQVFNKEAKGEFIECSRNGCSNEGDKRCIRCKLVSYCSKECQVAHWKGGHKKVCKKAVQIPALASQSAIQAARSIVSPALKKQDDFLAKNPQHDYRIVLPTGSQDAGVVFPHPLMKITFQMWRREAQTNPTAIARMYESLVECFPQHKKIIRQQLKAEYGTDPLSNEANTTENSAPTCNQIMDTFMSPDMIFYPEKPLLVGETPSGCSVRGTVGHESMFVVPLAIYEERLQKYFNNIVAPGASRVPIFAERTTILMALMHAGMHYNLNEDARAESTTLMGSEMKLKSQVLTLLDLLKGDKETFLFIPLEPFYCNIPHRMIGPLLDKMTNGQGLAEKVMRAYHGAKIYTHKKGPYLGAKPPDRDLIGPQPFTCGLRFQCGMSATIATISVFLLIMKAKLENVASNVFILPHALVLTKSSDHAKDYFNTKVQAFCSACYPASGTLYTAGNKQASSGIDNFSTKHLEKSEFIKMIKDVGCSWYPLFSENSSDNLFPMD